MLQLQFRLVFLLQYTVAPVEGTADVNTMSLTFAFLSSSCCLVQIQGNAGLVLLNVYYPNLNCWTIYTVLLTRALRECALPSGLASSALLSPWACPFTEMNKADRPSHFLCSLLSSATWFTISNAVSALFQYLITEVCSYDIAPNCISFHKLHQGVL